MTLTELRYIIAVARFRHFGKAAEACFVSQPTLSVGVRKPEEELGVRLFEHSRSEVIITDIGEEIVRQAETVIRAPEVIEETSEAAQAPSDANPDARRNLHDWTLFDTAPDHEPQGARAEFVAGRRREFH